MKNLRPLIATIAIFSLAGACVSDVADESTQGDSDAGIVQLDDTAAATNDVPQEIELPGATVFPEGVVFDDATGSVFVGSTDDGTIFRAGLDDQVAEVFLAPGEDGRTAATGLAVRSGLLFVAGRDTGRVFAYSSETAELLAAHDAAGGERSLINDIALSDDYAYVTDSFQPVLYRLSVDGNDVGEPEPWIDLSETSVPFDADGFNLNGIAVTDDGDTLYTVHYGTGELFRIDTATAVVELVDLGEPAQA